MYANGTRTSVMGSSASTNVNAMIVDVTQTDPVPSRPPSVGLPDEDELRTTPSPPVWTKDHAALLKGSPPPRGISLRAFEEWYRSKLKKANAQPAWSPSVSEGYSAMIDLWIRISVNRKPSPVIQSLPPLPSSPPRCVTLYK